MKPSTLSLFAVASFFAFSAHAQSVQGPEPSKNLIVKFCTTDYHERGRVLRCHSEQFLEKRGDDLVYLQQRDDSGEKGEFVRTGHLSSKSRPFSPATYVPHSYFLQFPLEVEKSWSGTFDQIRPSETRKRTRTARVTGYLDIVLKGGTFKAFQIDATNQWSRASNPAVERYYYCPELSMICRYESREFDMKLEVVEVTRVAAK